MSKEKRCDGYVTCKIFKAAASRVADRETLSLLLDRRRRFLAAQDEK
jgi:hypothetical protein